MKLPVRRSILFCLLFIAFLSAGGQENRRAAVKFNLFSPIDIFSFPVTQLSVEYRISKRISLAAEAGYLFYGFRKVDTVIFEPDGFKTSLEFRLYQLARSVSNRNSFPKLEDWYTGLKILYWDNKYTAGVTYYRGGGSSMVDYFGVRRIQYGAQVIFGLQETLHKRFLIDIYTGLGIVRKEIRNRDREFDFATDSIAGTDLVPYFASKNMSEESRGRRPIFSLGVRIGYRF